VQSGRRPPERLIALNGGGQQVEQPQPGGDLLAIGGPLPRREHIAHVTDPEHIPQRTTLSAQVFGEPLRRIGHLAQRGERGRLERFTVGLAGSLADSAQQIRPRGHSGSPVRRGQVVPLGSPDDPRTDRPPSRSPVEASGLSRDDLGNNRIDSLRRRDDTPIRLRGNRTADRDESEQV
jgi:hypothetical protein